MPIFICCDFCGETLNEPRGWVAYWRREHGENVDATFLHYGCVEEWLNSLVNTRFAGSKWHHSGQPKRSFNLKD